MKSIDTDACFPLAFYSTTSLVLDAKLGTGRIVLRLEYSSLDILLPDVINA